MVPVQIQGFAQGLFFMTAGGRQSMTRFRWSRRFLYKTIPLLVFALRCLRREFAAAGGEMIIHAALPAKNPPTSEVIYAK